MLSNQGLKESLSTFLIRVVLSLSEDVPLLVAETPDLVTGCLDYDALFLLSFIAANDESAWRFLLL